MKFPIYSLFSNPRKLTLMSRSLISLSEMLVLLNNEKLSKQNWLSKDYMFHYPFLPLSKNAAWAWIYLQHSLSIINSYGLLTNLEELLGAIHIFYFKLFLTYFNPYLQLTDISTNAVKPFVKYFFKSKWQGTLALGNIDHPDIFIPAIYDSHKFMISCVSPLHIYLVNVAWANKLHDEYEILN